MVKPSVGRIVHYTDDGTHCRAAVITEVTEPDLIGEVHLCVLSPAGLSFRRLVRQAGLAENTAVYPPGTWHWPERVGD